MWKGVSRRHHPLKRGNTSRGPGKRGVLDARWSSGGRGELKKTRKFPGVLTSVGETVCPARYAETTRKLCGLDTLFRTRRGAEADYRLLGYS